MNCRTSCFKYGRAMLCENIRRFWPIPVVGFLTYFLSGVFPILIHYQDLDSISSYIELSLNNEQPFFLVTHLFLPIITAVLVFRYLHGSSSVAVIHAMPFNRKTLYFSNYLSGLALCLVPVLVTGLIFLCLAKPVYIDLYQNDPLTGESVKTLVNVFSHAAIGHWMLESFLIVLFLFSIAVFAGIVTGNSLMHFFTALGFNFLAPVLYLTVLHYFETYLFGYSVSAAAHDKLMSLSPLLLRFQNGEPFPLSCDAAYLAVSAAVTAIGLFLYLKRPLEKCGNTLVFPFMEILISFLITLFSLTLFGNYFDAMGHGTFYRAAGYLAGMVIGFLIGQMLVKKTVRIFNLASLKRLAAYICVFAAFFCCLVFDLTGYETRIPDADKIASVRLEADFLNRYSKSCLASGTSHTDFEPVTLFSEEENIQVLRDFHEKLLDDRALYEEDKSRYVLRTGTVAFRYNLKDGRTVSRDYAVPKQLLLNYDFLASLYESDEFRKTPFLATIPEEALNSVTFYRDNAAMLPDDANNDVTLTDMDDMKQLIAAIVKDTLNCSFQNMMRTPPALLDVEVDFTTFSKATDQPVVSSLNTQGTQRNRLDITVYPYYENTLAWLVEHGYEQYTVPLSEFADYMVVEFSADDYTDANPIADTKSDEDFSTKPKFSENALTITDRAQMNEAMQACEEDVLDYDNHYLVTLAIPNPNADRVMDENEYQYITYIINPENLPKFIEDHYKQ